MGLKSVIREKLLTEVINGDQGTRGRQVLIVDKLSTRLVSSCLQMHDLCEGGVTLVEDINRKREPIRNMTAIYLLTPIESNIQALIRDFESNPLYQSAYVYFTEAIPDELFDKLQGQKVVNYMKTCKEINISFVPFEDKVFSLDDPQMFQSLYSPNMADSKSNTMTRMAEQIATLCASLGEYPSIRYRDGWENNRELSEMVLQRLNAYKNDDPKMGEGPGMSKSTLLILDRGFDCVSPFLHEFTYQAMIYDLLPIKNDVYKYTNQGVEKEVLLDENDDLWCKLRHIHIADATKLITADLQTFQMSKLHSSIGSSSIRDLSKMIKEMPQHQKKLLTYAKHMNLAEDCMQRYKGHVARLVSAEQDLVMGIDAEGEEIRDHMKNIAQVLLDDDLSVPDRVRLIVLYVMIRNGISEENFHKLAIHGQFEEDHCSMIQNMSHLGVNITSKDYQQFQYSRRDRSSIVKYTTSRWTPIVKDLMEDFAEGKLNENLFPFLINRSNGAAFTSLPQSSRFGNWRQDGKSTGKSDRKVPRLIIFIAGGMTYSEMRCAYEVSKINENYDFIVGSTHILTPETFLNNLAKLSDD